MTVKGATGGVDGRRVALGSLAQVQVGIAMGTGTDVAMESAGVLRPFLGL